MKIIRVFILALVVTSLSIPVLAAPKVKKYKKNDFYQQSMGKFSYIADTVTQTCFMNFYDGSLGGLTEIPCENLAKREEWKEVLNWLKPVEPEAVEPTADEPAGASVPEATEEKAETPKATPPT